MECPLTPCCCFCTGRAPPHEAQETSDLLPTIEPNTVTSHSLQISDSMVGPPMGVGWGRETTKGAPSPSQPEVGPGSGRLKEVVPPAT